MTRILAATTLLAILAACGADGPPTPPPAKEPSRGGISISGDGRFGLETNS